MTATTRRRAAAITDVARLAGVSHQTVSRVLNGHPAVSSATRARVLTAIRQLDYRPNALARTLAGGRSRMIGVISPDTPRYGSLATLFGIERAARAAGYGMITTALERVDYHGVLSAVGALAGQSVAGVVVIAAQRAAAAALQHLPSGTAAVAVEPDGDSQVPAVCTDQAGGARLAVVHLLRLGHSSVWHVAGPEEALDARARADGWRRTLQQAGIAPPPPVTGDWSAQSGYQAGLRLADRDDVTAVFAGNDQMALGLIRAFTERNIRVPDDVSVVGFDDIPEAEFLTPPLTTVRQDFDAVGQRCFAALLQRIEAGFPDTLAHSASEAAIRPSLVVRRSTAARPEVRRPLVAA
ncbi:LacI family DNA-binding transcriptional regulator [Dactylosporangium sp. CA-233914]|uniref:LacI family DNA-binding transcriptional regulator n=1 Tax=Dactylosporangium sp. CA-233914 TaxID=3239934 RepID=UPI003D93C852